jgi:CubicO group peptidase (beta-lactamase class C family)
MVRKHISALVLLLSIAALVPAQVDKVADHVKAEMKTQRIPGVSLAVVKNGKVILAEGYGLANVELNVAAGPETVFKIGSVSKQFIATGIMLLVQEGKVSLDDKINQYLEQPPDTWKEISVRHLLTHTSGLVREAPGFDPMKVQTDADVIKTAYPLPLRFQPGEKWEYCNVGYFTLAEIIRKVTGKAWGDYLNERVFSPLGMNATRTTSSVDIVPNRADGYAWRSDKLQNADNWSALRPSGAFLSSVLDLAKWEAALYSDKVLTQTSRDQMWAAVKLNDGTKHPYGFGWQLDEVGGVPAIRHGGSLPGFRAQFMRFPGHGLTIIVLCNLEGGNPERIARGVASLFISEVRNSATDGGL